MGLADVGGSAFQFGNNLPSGGAYVYNLRYGRLGKPGEGDKPDGFWWFQFANLDAGYALGLGTGIEEAQSPWSESGTTKFAFVSMPNGLRIGRGSGQNGVFVDSGDEAPASGKWSVGDIVLNASPKAGGYVGWVYTDGGWKKYGLVENTA